MLLGRSQDHDWSLVRLNQSPPAGAYLAGWTRDPVLPNAITVTLHHPEGDLKKWSQGSVQRPVFNADDLVHGTFNQVPYAQGITEGGSSGSALLTYLASGDYYEVRGAPVRRQFRPLPGAGGRQLRRLLADGRRAAADARTTSRRTGRTRPDRSSPSSSTTRRSTIISCRRTRRRSTTSTPACTSDGSAPACASSPTRPRSASASPVCRFYREPSYRRLALLFGEPAECAAYGSRAPGRLDLRKPERLLHPATRSRRRARARRDRSRCGGSSTR